MRHHILWISQILKSSDVFDLDQNPSAFRDSTIAKCANYRDDINGLSILYSELLDVFDERMKDENRKTVKTHDRCFVDLLEHIDKMRGENRNMDIVGRLFNGANIAANEATRAYSVRMALKAFKNICENEPENMSDALAHLGHYMIQMPTVFADIELDSASFDAYKELFDFIISEDIAPLVQNATRPNEVTSVLHAMCLFGAHNDGVKKGKMPEELFSFVMDTMRSNETARTGFSKWAPGLIKFLDGATNTRQFGHLMAQMYRILENDQIAPLKVDDLVTMMGYRNHDLSLNAVGTLESYFKSYSEHFPTETVKVFNRALDDIEGLTGLANWRDFNVNAERKTCENLYHYTMRLLENPTPDAEDMLERLDIFALKMIEKKDLAHKERLDNIVSMMREKIINVNGLDDDENKYPKRKIHFDRPMPY